MHNRRRRLERGSVARSGRAAKVRPKKRAARAKASASRSPAGWARWIRRRYELDASEDVLVDLAVLALRLSQGQGEDARTRLQAAGRFQSLLRQLGLEAAEEEEARRGESEKDVVRFAAGRR